MPVISLRLTGDSETGSFIESVAENACPDSTMDATKMPEATAQRIGRNQSRSVNLGTLADIHVSVAGDCNRVGLRFKTKVRHVVEVEGEEQITGLEAQPAIVGLAYPFVGEQTRVGATYRSNRRRVV